MTNLLIALAGLIILSLAPGCAAGSPLRPAATVGISPGISTARSATAGRFGDRRLTRCATSERFHNS